jgi:hypothetical protein
MFNRMVVATDIVITADAPVVSAARFARQQAARFYLLHVMESASTENRHPDPSFRDRRGNDLRCRL